MHFEELLKLQKLDQELDQIKLEQKQYPSQLEDVKNEYDTKISVFEALTKRRDALKTETVDLKEKLALENTRLDKSKTRLNEIKNNFEYQALRREIDGTEKSNHDLEKNIAQKSTDLEALEAQIKEKETALKTIETKFDEVKSLLDEKTDHYAVEIKKKADEVEKYYAHIDKVLLQKYKFIRTRLEKAVVNVEGGSCRGCFMNLPPQMVNEMHSTKDLYNCPSCHRILFLDSYIAD